MLISYIFRRSGAEYLMSWEPLDRVTVLRTEADDAADLSASNVDTVILGVFELHVSDAEAACIERKLTIRVSVLYEAHLLGEDGSSDRPLQVNGDFLLSQVSARTVDINRVGGRGVMHIISITDDSP